MSTTLVRGLSKRWGKMKLLKNVYVRATFKYSVAAFYAALFLALLAWKWVRHPLTAFWRVKRREICPEYLLDPARGNHCYAQLKNIKLHYVEKGDKKNPLMLFVHGFPEFWYSWRHQMDEFAKDHWVVALDMRGYGDSDKPQGIKNYAMRHLVNDLKELVEHLGRKKFTLVAHDWGGVVAWVFVETQSEMLDRYIIMDAPRMQTWSKLVLTQRKQFFMSWYCFFYQVPLLPELFLFMDDFRAFPKVFRGDTPKEKSAITDQDIEAYKYTFSKPGSITGPINYYRANLFSSQRIVDGLTTKADPGVPGLLIFGEKDNYLDSQFITLAKDNVKDLTVKIIEGGNHFVQQDVPKTVNSLMRQFIKEN